MALLDISLLGRFDVKADQQSLIGFGPGKVRELFCYLLLYRERPHSREYLADLLWEDSQADRPNRCLRKTIWQLRAALDSLPEKLSERVLIIEPDWIQLSPGAKIWLDIAVFEQAFRRFQPLPYTEFDTETVDALDDTVNLYQGGLQESWYQDWYLYERERFQHMYLIMLDKLMAYWEAQHRYATGLEYGSRILLCERARECTHRRLMRLHYLAGDRTAALRQYERCATILHEELDVVPSQRTLALYEQIRNDQVDDSTRTSILAEQGLQTGSYRLPHILHVLGEVQAALTQIQQEILEELQVLEPAAGDRFPDP